MKNANRLRCFIIVVSAFVMFTALHSPANGAEAARSKTAVKKNQPASLSRKRGEFALQKALHSSNQEHAQKYAQRSKYPVANGDIRSTLKREIWNAQQPPKPLSVKKKSAAQILQQRNRQTENQFFFRNKRKQMSSVDSRTSMKKKNYVTPALQQTKEKKKLTQTSAPAPAQSSVTKGESRHTTQATIALAAIAVCIALGGTLAIMVLVSKRPAQKVVKKESRIQVEPLQRTSLQIPTFFANEAVQPNEETSFDFHEEEENAIELAQRFHRGQGELKLAFNLQSHGKAHSTIEKLMHSRSIGKPNGNKKLLAKRLGIGNGEVELALKFKKLQHAQRNESHSHYYQEVV